ncbi:photosynthetic reaction center cytochrome PufC [Elioraea sp.]|uniref:photosynthetic reaction center cytochrome PufC n=1 Tax=Elioraea sp. TaxID=2185103 RepID=UPI0025C167AD|nr:photosynthetic reaction center cytochrome PufC [Elioraea sp.]
MNIFVQCGIGVAAVVGAAVTFLTFERPPIETVQRGFRGTAQELVYTTRAVDRIAARNVVPEADPPVDPIGQKSSEVYENVQVLGDLDAGQFIRLMAAITAWVSPEQGCNYCHNPENLASDEVYTKVVTRRMLQMTKAINTNWKPHVQETGVTCYTCHRGQPIPAYVWSTEPGRSSSMLASSAGQNVVSSAAGLTSLPYDPFTAFFRDALPIRVAGTTPHGPDNRASIKQTEWTYGLMMHFSQATGANCTFCHNTQNFANWNDAPPQRHSAWHGIRMVREINNTYIEPLTPLWAANRNGPPERGSATMSRLGPHGDALKVNCASCHQGAHKPLLGAPMLSNYPELNAVSSQLPRSASMTPR